MTQKATILVLGAGGTTGRAIVGQALEAGHVVRAADPSGGVGLPPHPQLETVAANILSDDLDPLVDGAGAVISAMGLGLSPQTVLDPPPLYTEGTLRVVRAMRRAGPTRLVTISAVFAAQEQTVPGWFRAAAWPALGRVFAQMADMERLLQACEDIAWTAVRPGWLLEAPLTGDYVIAENVLPRGLLRTRHADLAQFMLRCATSDEWLRRTPAIARREPLRHSSPAALLSEIAALPRLQPPRRG